MKYINPFIILLFVFISSCRKDEPLSYCDQFPQDCVNIQEVKDYMYFDVGTWWLYEEENTLQKDCVYVTSSSNNTNYQFYYTIARTSDEWLYDIYPLKGQGCPSEGLIEEGTRCILVERAKHTPGGYEGAEYFFFFHALEGDYIYNYSPDYPNGTLSFQGISDSTINSFSETLIFEDQHTQTEENQRTRSYYYKGVGLVRKEIVDSNKVWNLINYNIVK